MRLFLTLTLMLCITGWTSAATAEDGFGSRFSADAPAALQEDPEAALADIAPAAGEEDVAPEAEEDVQAEEEPTPEVEEADKR